jgi:hypothetical protein
VDGRRCEGPDRHKERGAGGTWKFSMGFVWYMYKLKALIFVCGISQSTNFTSFLKSLVFVYMSKIMIPYPYHIRSILLSILIYACKKTQHLRDKSHTQSSYLGWVNLAPTTILIK